MTALLSTTVEAPVRTFRATDTLLPGHVVIPSHLLGAWAKELCGDHRHG